MAVQGNNPKTDPFSGHIGDCETCGAKNVAVTHKPRSRCIDMRACDAQRAKNAELRAQQARPSQSKPVIDTSKRFVAHIRRRGVVCYFHREYIKKYAENGQAFLSDEYIWELVPEKKAATRLTANEVAAIQSVWAEAKFEDA